MRSFAFKFLFVLIVAQTATLAQTAAPAQTKELQELFDSRRYFELREALAKRTGDDSAELLFYRGATANRFNELERSAELLRKFVKKADKDSPLLDEAYEILADNYTKEHEYGKAADAYKFLLDNYRGRLDKERIEDYENVFGLWSALRHIPRQTVSFTGDSTVQGTRDAARLLNIPVEIGGIKQDFVFDTGANLSTMTLSTAQKLGLKIIEADVSVGSSTDIKVKSKLAVAPSMKIGSATVRNAVFLVLEDKALHFPQINYQIHGIVGFPVMQSLGKISIAKNNQIGIFAESEKTATEPNLSLQGFLPLIAARHDNRRLVFVFDTGAVATDLYLPFYKANQAQITKDQTPQKVKVGGAGGFREVSAYRLPSAEIMVGGKTAKISNVRVMTEQTNDDSRYFDGNLGQDVIKQFDKMTLDFRTMRISFE